MCIRDRVNRVQNKLCHTDTNNQDANYVKQYQDANVIDSKITAHSIADFEFIG